MSRVRGTNTSPEIRVRKEAHSIGLRFRLHPKDLPGKPDLVFPKFRTALFVHGCFWHRHPGCAKASTPKTRQAYWQAKFSANSDRDERVQRALEELGWRVLVIWECETKKPEQLSRWLIRHFGVSTTRGRLRSSTLQRRANSGDED
ncbi:very short patch repair endonuclease [Bradyrhizobium sp. SZCCHNR2012]|uniref:very short patch repair endonuclease n=1 Tax=Bradyrhizobium sp. SZCCHNR2012 TaxID=3057377 RepID=UPI0039656AEE